MSEGGAAGTPSPTVASPQVSPPVESPSQESPPLDGDLLHALMDHLDEVVLCCTPEGTITFANAATRLVLGHHPDQVLGRNLVEFVHPDEQDEAAESLLRWEGRSGTPRGQGHEIATADGQWLSMHYEVVVGDGALPLGGIVLTLRPAADHDPTRRDLLQRVLNEDRLVRLASTFLRHGIDDFGAGLDEAMAELAGLEWVTRASVWVVDTEEVVCRSVWAARANAPTRALPERAPRNANRVLRRLEVGEEVHIRSVQHLPQDWAVERSELTEAGVRSLVAVPMTDTGHFLGFVMVEVTLSELAFDASALATLRSSAAILAAALVRHEAEVELARRAHTDVLTGLANRWAFLDEVAVAQRALKDGRVGAFAVALVDFDRFTLLNDAYGHDAGDQLLVAAADRMRRAAPGGTLVARLHADEFLVLHPAVDATAEAASLTEVVVDALTPPFDLDGRPVRLDVSAGVVVVDDPDVEGPELLRRADLVMQDARVLGAGRVAVESEALHEQVTARFEREVELRASVAAGELEVYFQGEWDLGTGTLVGAEALARWPHPRAGLLAASEFIPVAEECGVIVELGTSVLRSACRLAAGWPAHLILRVNLAPRQLLAGDLVAVVRSALEAGGLESHRLCLELTESALLRDPARSVAVLHGLRSLGVGLAIDDFGTGYSSLAYLKHLPVTSLKIDRAFVAGLPEDATDQAIVRTVVSLAETMDFTVTGEGVERPEQRQALLDLGCTRAQGFLLSVPEPPDAFAARL